LDNLTTEVQIVNIEYNEMQFWMTHRSITNWFVSNILELWHTN